MLWQALSGVDETVFDDFLLAFLKHGLTYFHFLTFYRPKSQLLNRKNTQHNSVYKHQCEGAYACIPCCISLTVHWPIFSGGPADRAKASHEIMEGWLVRAAEPPGIFSDVWKGVSLPPLSCLPFPHMWVWRGWAQEVCGRCGAQSALIYFLHLLWFLQQGPEHSWSWARCWAVCPCLEPAVSAQPGLSSVRWVSLARSVPPVLTTTFSCRRNDTSAATSSILIPTWDQTWLC